MSLRDSTFLIRDYDNIRQILRAIYIFGCFTRDDFIEMGISGRKYDNEQRRISSYLSQKFIQKRRIDKKVLLYCSYSMQDSEKNYLADTFRNKSFTTLDIMAYFFVQQILADGKEMTASDLLDAMPIYNESVIFTKDNLRVKLDELVEKGFIESRKDGRTVLYKLVEDMWSDFSDVELEEICLYLEYVKNVSPLEIPYYFLEQKLHLYMECERNIKIQSHKVFALKHNHFFNSLDNEILIQILRGCSFKRALKLSMENGKDRVVLPIKVIHDSTYGRQYLYCFDIGIEKQSVIRIDRICSVNLSHKMNCEEKQIIDGIMSVTEECWCTSGVNSELREIVIEFKFDEVKEAYILRRIRQEGHNGEITRVDEGIYKYRARLRDPDEMIPWIRSFGERAKVVYSEGKNTIGVLAEDWKRAVKNYESI